MNRQLATVFDLDKTLVNCNASFDFGKFLYKNGFFGIGTAIALCLAYLLHKIKLLTIHQLHSICWSKIFQNKDINIVHSHVDTYLEERLESILNRSIYQKMQLAKECGHYILLLSSSPCFLVSKIGNKLAVDVHLGTPYDPFQTRVVDGNSKATFMKQWAIGKNVQLEDVTVYTDSSLDLPLMKIVGNPKAVGPSLLLRLHCYLRGWEIVNV